MDSRERKKKPPREPEKWIHLTGTGTETHVLGVTYSLLFEQSMSSVVIPQPPQLDCRLLISIINLSTQSWPSAPNIWPSAPNMNWNPSAVQRGHTPHMQNNTHYVSNGLVSETLWWPLTSTTLLVLSYWTNPLSPIHPPRMTQSGRTHLRDHKEPRKVTIHTITLTQWFLSCWWIWQQLFALLLVVS